MSYWFFIFGIILGWAFMLSCWEYLRKKLKKDKENVKQ